MKYDLRFQFFTLRAALPNLSIKACFYLMLRREREVTSCWRSISKWFVNDKVNVSKEINGKWWQVDALHRTISWVKADLVSVYDHIFIQTRDIVITDYKSLQLLKEGVSVVLSVKGCLWLLLDAEELLVTPLLLGVGLHSLSYYVSLVGIPLNRVLGPTCTVSSTPFPLACFSVSILLYNLTFSSLKAFIS